MKLKGSACKALVVGVAVVGLVTGSWVTGASAAAPHTFRGACQVTATSSGSYTAEGFRVEGDGTCTGLLDGEQVTETPVSTTASGSGLFFVGGWTNGSGTLVFDVKGVRFPIRFEAFVPGPIRVYPSCFGCSGAAVGVVDPVTLMQPQPGPAGPQRAIRIVVTTVQEFVA